VRSKLYYQIVILMNVEVLLLGVGAGDDCQDLPSGDMKERIYQIIKENPGYTAIDLYRKIPRPTGIPYKPFKRFLCYLIKTHKVAEDSEGQLCWIYNPELTHKYLSHPELFI